MNGEIILLGILCILPGIIGLIFPAAFIKFGDKWKYKDCEPSDTAIIVARIASVFCILIGVVFSVLGAIWDKI